MKKIIVIVCCIFSAIGCNTNSVEKPDNLIPKEKMVDILYDISLIEAIKNQNIEGGLSSKTANDYIYKKYKVDSIQFVKSNKYYVSNMEQYKKMFEEVKARLAKETAKAEAEMKKNGQQVPPTSPIPVNPDVPQIR
jgi:hypothetical protein